MTTREERFASFVRPGAPDECWPWYGSVKNPWPRDYGMFWDGGRNRPAHVVAWEIEHGQPFPVGMHGCHHCDRARCVNPAHIFPGSISDNRLDSVSKLRARLPDGTVIDPERCKRGHRRTPENMVGTSRNCRACAYAMKRARQERIALRAALTETER